MLCLTATLSCSKSNNPLSSKCYKCEAISQGTTYKENPCTDGDPYEKVPKKDPNGNNLGWICTEQ